MSKPFSKSFSSNYYAFDLLLVHSLSSRIITTCFFIFQQTHYHINKSLYPTSEFFHDLYRKRLLKNMVRKEENGKYCEKRRKCWSPAFSPFHTMFSSLAKEIVIIEAIFTLSSANTYDNGQVWDFDNLVKSLNKLIHFVFVFCLNTMYFGK